MLYIRTGCDTDYTPDVAYRASYSLILRSGFSKGWGTVIRSSRRLSEPIIKTFAALGITTEMLTTSFAIDLLS